MPLNPSRNRIYDPTQASEARFLRGYYSILTSTGGREAMANPQPLPNEQQPLLFDENWHRTQDADDATSSLPTNGDPGLEQAGGGAFTRNLGALEAFAIVISIVIGSGVFTSPGSIDTNVPSPGAALLVWLVGGVLAWTGAVTVAELGTAIPDEGGVQPYLKYIYGDVFGFLAAWTWVVAV